MQHARTVTKIGAEFLSSCNLTAKRPLGLTNNNASNVVALVTTNGKLPKLQKTQTAVKEERREPSVRRFCTASKPRFTLNVTLKQSKEGEGGPKEEIPKVEALSEISRRTISSVLENIKRRLTERDIAALEGCFEIYLEGKDKTSWYVEFKDARMHYSKGRSVFPPDVTFYMDELVFLDLFSGRRNPFPVGKIEIRGNVLTGLKFINRFSGKAKYIEDYDKPYWYPERH